jgi:uncharacterized membrane protein YccC
MSTAFTDARSAPLGWLGWLRRELAPSHDRKVRTLILTCGAVLCVIISMALQVPELAVSAYMIFFISKENKTVTTSVGVLALIGLTIGIAVTLLLYQFTYGHAELRIPSMAIVLFLGMYLSRVLVLGPLAFVLGFIIAATQSIGDLLPSPELMVRAMLWLWVALAYAIGLTVVLNQLFLPKPAGPPEPIPKRLFVPDAFTNPAHVRFALKVTLAAMLCFVLFSAVDWFGIHTAFITCVFISLESTGATLRKGVLRAAGCVIGGLAALFSIIFLIPHMETIVSLAILIACVSAIAGWIATGTERIAYAGLQIAFAFYYALFRGFGFAPDTDLHNVRDRAVGILLGLVVTTLVFHYLWPERAVDRLRDLLHEVLRQLARLLVIPRPETPINQAKPKVEALIAEISRELEKARREAELTSFEADGPPPRENVSPACLEIILSRVEHLWAMGTSFNSESAWTKWQQLPPEAQEAESQLRNFVARRIECAANRDGAEEADAHLAVALARWTEIVRRLSLNGSRVALVSQIGAQAQDLGFQAERQLNRPGQIHR